MLAYESSRARGTHESESREKAPDPLLAGADRAGRLVEQRLQMTRFEPDAQPFNFSDVRFDLLAKAESVSWRAPTYPERNPGDTRHSTDQLPVLGASSGLSRSRRDGPHQ